MSAIGIFENDE